MRRTPGVVNRMWRQRWTTGSFFLGLVVVAVLAARLFRTSPPRTDVGSVEDRVSQLKMLVGQQERESDGAVNRYTPDVAARLDDLTAPVEPNLRGLPGVVNVEVNVRADRPTHRIVHLRDRHCVPKELYAIDLKDAAGRGLTDAEIDLRHQELLLEVEAVQLEQMALLRCLIKHHGLRRVYHEGLTTKDLPSYRKRIAGLRSLEQNEFGQLRKQLADVRELLSAMDPTTDRYQEAKKIESQITAMLDDHMVRLLELGAAGRLLIAGEIDEVIPLDDADRLDEAKPVTPDGKVKADPAKVTAREDAQVRAVLAQGAFGLIVLGGSHDLSDSVRRLGGGRCDYIRVTTRRYRDFSE